MSYFSLSLSFFNSFNYKIQAYLGDIAGSVPDYRNKASLVDFLVSQCIKNRKIRDFPGGPVVKTLRFHCRGTGLIPGQGTKIPHATWCGPKKKKKLKN